jgi:hypothetical protein
MWDMYNVQEMEGGCSEPGSVSWLDELKIGSVIFSSIYWFLPFWLCHEV